MQGYSETQIRTLHAEFSNQKKYTGKLAFFDLQFGIIPFGFPDFDPRLGFFFQKEKMELLEGLFKKERNNPELTQRKYSFNEIYIFNIKPANSNSAAYSSYILNRFLAYEPRFEEWFSERISVEKPVEYFLDEANGLINTIEYGLQYEYDKSFKLQSMSVFFKGFQDGFSNKFNIPGKKRKFTELYLYAQGIIYSNYIRFLKNEFRKFRDPVHLQRRTQLDLAGKLELLKELGIIGFLRNRYAELDPADFENKIVEIFCLISDEYADKRETVSGLLSAINRQDSDEPVKHMAVTANRHLVQLNTEKQKTK